MKKIRITKKQWKTILPIRIITLILLFPVNFILHLFMLIGKIPYLFMLIGQLGEKLHSGLNSALIDLFIFIIKKYSENKKIEIIEENREDKKDEDSNENKSVVNR